jgi:hypothetical protein
MFSRMTNMSLPNTKPYFVCEDEGKSSGRRENSPSLLLEERDCNSTAHGDMHVTVEVNCSAVARHAAVPL